ncbi:hypothetical protein VF21_07956 [Pseudogymnoascus sp. 05NY08]|nr:hypothetical protein VF21_07956 [Pseudogymnoascus sp. 05NY08]
MTDRSINASEVLKHNTSESCWVTLYGKVYDVTNFVDEHPGGRQSIMRLAGRDATEDFDLVHPKGTLEQNLPAEAYLGKVSLDLLSAQEATTVAESNFSDSSSKAVPLDQLLSIADLEKQASKQLKDKAWSYYYSASDDEISKRLNSESYRAILMRPRVFCDVETVSTEVKLLNNPFKLPIFVAPAAMGRLAHESGECGISDACGAHGVLQIISNNASYSLEDIVENSAPGQVYGFQLYVQSDKRKSEDMIQRVNKLRHKIKFIVLTVDAPTPGKREQDERIKNKDYPSGIGAKPTKAPEAPAGGIGKALFAGTSGSLVWGKTLGWLSAHTDLPIVIKGIQTHEDACMALRYAPQVQGIILSNHGGRACDTAPPALHTLLEIRKYCPEVLEKTEVWIDGGVQRGTDVVKALALGARGVGLGRAPLYGLSVGGAAGVSRMITILREEIETALRLLGVNSIAELSPKHVNTRALEALIYAGETDSTFKSKL